MQKEPKLGPNVVKNTRASFDPLFTPLRGPDTYLWVTKYSTLSSSSLGTFFDIVQGSRDNIDFQAMVIT